MRDSSRPTMAEISVVLSHLAQRVSADQGPGLDPIVAPSLERAVIELQRHIPGLEKASDADAARSFAVSATDALAHGREQEALARALRGLSCAPQDPHLHYLAGSACFELGAVETALKLISHALWVNPGHPEARRDLDALDAFRDPSKRKTGASSRRRADPSENPAAAPLDVSGPRTPPERRLRFEFFDDDANESGGEERAA
ncbi:MAG TPA: hypothetical protein VEY91_11750 [Candidatus Limnocylindria bacterium]|nr:hypothetical protein [Candidatus Limnocylindria bacterium]